MCIFGRVSEDFQPSDEDEDDEDIEESDYNVDDDDEEEEEEEGGSARKKMGGKKLKCSLSEQQLLVASFSPSEFTLKKPLNPKLLDSRVLKALKKQEERKEKKAARKKQVGLFNAAAIRFVATFPFQTAPSL